MKRLSGGKPLATSKTGYDDDNDEQSGRWLISYADLITTLMVLFLALYVLQLARSKELEMKLFEHAIVTQRAEDVATHTTKPASLSATTSKQQLLSLLEPLRASQQITIANVPQGVEIAINAKILFNSGDAHLLPASSNVLSEIADILRSHSNNNILVEGHTDSQPISNAKYESNWELSSARAGAVVRFLSDRGIAAHRLAAIGRADNFPLVVGDDAAARAANRRVTILVEG
jgi:chemotaxis protein MotB